MGRGRKSLRRSVGWLRSGGRRPPQRTRDAGHPTPARTPAARDGRRAPAGAQGEAARGPGGRVADSRFADRAHLFRGRGGGSGAQDGPPGDRKTRRDRVQRGVSRTHVRRPLGHRSRPVPGSLRRPAESARAARAVPGSIPPGGRTGCRRPRRRRPGTPGGDARFRRWRSRRGRDRGADPGTRRRHRTAVRVPARAGATCAASAASC